MQAGKPVTAVVVGAGHRGILYAKYALKHPEEMKIVGVVDPAPSRRAAVAEAHDLTESHCFASVEELIAQPKVADAAINATMDRLHVPTTLPLLKAGYDVLLEKPAATSRQELLALRDAARAAGRIVMICHVLRYAPFYFEIRRRLAEGVIGTVLAVESLEHVSYHHMGVGFIRGKWNRQERCQSSMLMAKCCHDLDLLAWMKSGVSPRRVGSFGSLMYFRPKNAPPGSGTRCLADCQIEAECPHSARKIYIDRGKWGFYAWESLGSSLYGKDLTVEQKLQSLRTDNPYGRCVWRCDNDVVDHQTVMVEFSDGSTASHNMIGGSAKAGRVMHIIGSHGEIQGCMEEGRFCVRHPDPSAEHLYSEEVVDTRVVNDMHGGGDLRLVGDFVARLRGQAPSLSCTALEDSLYGALIGFAAEDSRHAGGSAVMIEL